MSETVEAVGYKADVPSRTKDAVSDKVENMKSKVSDTATRAKEAVVGTASRAGDATASRGQVKQAGRRAAGMAKENPLGLAIGAVAVGFLAGMLIPSTRVEDEKIGPMADQVKEQIKETGQEALEHGKAVVQETASSAADAAKQTAQEQGKEHASQVKDSAQQSAQQTREQVRS
jgi:gas vesicle protein